MTVFFVFVGVLGGSCSQDATIGAGLFFAVVADLERVCDYLIVLVGSRVRIAGPVEELLATHHLLSGPRRDPATLPAGQQVISASHTDRQTTLLVRTSDPVLDPAWTVSEIGLEDLVLAYMSQATRRGRRDLEVQK